MYLIIYAENQAYLSFSARRWPRTTEVGRVDVCQGRDLAKQRISVYMLFQDNL